MSERPVTPSYVSALIQEPPLSPPSIGATPVTAPPLPPFEPLRTVTPPPAPPAPAPEPVVAPPAPAAVAEAVEPVAPAVAPEPEPEPADEAPTRPLLPLETLLLRFQMLTLEQLSEAMREEAVTGTPVSRYIVERGWVSDEDIARIVTPPQNPPAPPIAAAPPVTSVHPEPTPIPAAPPEPELQARPAVTFQVLAHLATGERIEIARSDDAASAKSAAAKAMREIAEAKTDWPFLAGRFVRPEAIVSIDVAPLA